MRTVLLPAVHLEDCAGSGSDQRPGAALRWKSLSERPAVDVGRAVR